MTAKYFLGKPCRSGHGNQRYVSTRHCVKCQSLKTEAYRKANLAKRSAQEAARRKANPLRTRAIKRASYVRNAEKNKLASSAYRKANPERGKLRQIEWRKSNQASTIASNARRHARKMNAPGRGVSTAEWRQVIAESFGLCAYCGEREPPTMDHIEPLSKGGAHDTDNLALACLQCNGRKMNTPLLLWLVRRARTRALERAA